jgi:preprotein translocase subunit SecD
MKSIKASRNTFGVKFQLNKHVQLFIWIILLAVASTLIALPKDYVFSFSAFGKDFAIPVSSPKISFDLFGWHVEKEFVLKQGLDIQGGMQVVLKADMSQIPSEKKEEALNAAKEIILRRVDMYGVSEPVVQTSVVGDESRILVELAGVDNSSQALQLVGRTAQLDFRLEGTESATASDSAKFIGSFRETGLTGKDLKDASAQFDPQNGQPVVALQFTPEGTEKFAKITQDNVGQVLAIFIDGFPVTLPRISTPILTGEAVMSGSFTVEDAKQLAIQLDAGSLPVPITVLEQRTLGASLGQESVKASVFAGLVGLGLVMAFMVLYYGSKGFLSVLSLMLYGVLTIALYKILGITVTLPGIAGLLLSVGMAVDSSILVFERMKEELRLEKPIEIDMELGFGRAWDSIKDANIATIMTAFILINPLDFPFLNTSGMVRGFGVTLLLGVLTSLFTGIVVTRTLMRLFLKGSS